MGVEDTRPTNCKRLQKTHHGNFNELLTYVAFNNEPIHGPINFSHFATSSAHFSPELPRHLKFHYHKTHSLVSHKNFLSDFLMFLARLYLSFKLLQRLNLQAYLVVDFVKSKSLD